MNCQSTRTISHGTLLLLTVLSGCTSRSHLKTIRLAPGLVISESVTIEKDHYQIQADSLGAIQIFGDDVTVDFNGATLDGASSGQAPDEFSGTGVLIKGSRGVTIKNATIRGYKVGIMATDVPDLHVTASDLSYNWRQRLKSTVERESQDDWMSYHQNENDEWLRYGAAIYLRRAERARIDRVVVTGGQNGIMATETNDALFYNNTITFNSSVGIALYRSSRNRILHNRLDFNVRGHSPGVYHRGQDSAALLLYEQSSENIIAYNSATHSGDGLFLWAGQSTIDTGEGGCNDNLIYSNDFSYAPTNGIEVTFSRNWIIENKIRGCWHGIWGGYSFDTQIEGNEFVDNEEHIAIEHGQRITIGKNRFAGGLIGVRLWERKRQPVDWGYSRNRDVRSGEYLVTGNSFAGVEEPFQVENTINFRETGNSFSTPINSQESVNDRLFAVPDGSDLVGTDSIVVPARVQTPSIPEKMQDAQSVELRAGQPTGRKYMLIDEWGPYDFRSPILWPRSSRSVSEQTFEVLGPPGRWTLLQSRGIVSISRTSGEIRDRERPDTLVIRLKPDRVLDVQLEMEYVGSAITDRFGRKTEAGRPFLFSYSYFFLPVDWSISFFAYDERTDPRSAYPSFRRLIQGDPISTTSVHDLALQWVGSPAPGVPEDHFATVVEGRFQAPAGNYKLDLTSDDGVRVWLDGNLIHDDWTYHAPTSESIPIVLGGDHQIHIEHFEIDGYSTLIVSIKKESVPLLVR